MKQPDRSTLLLITSARVARVDFHGGAPEIKAAARPRGTSLVEAVRAALALGGKPGAVHVLSEDVFEHQVRLKAAQVAGLPPEQLARALSYEMEPFSGILVADSAIGFHRVSEGVYEVIELTREDRDAIQRAVAAAGGKLAGIAHPGPTPDEAKWPEWLTGWFQLLREGRLPLITPPPPAPSANRFFVVGAALEGAALLVVVIWGILTTLERQDLQARSRELNTANSRQEEAKKQIANLKKELATLDKEQGQRTSVTARRGALLALLNGIAATHGEDVVLQAIEAEGPSSLIISGLSLEASGADELSIVLTQSLRSAGWTAQPRSKTGKRTLVSGGPWEFSLTVTHDEVNYGKDLQLSMRRSQ